MSLIVVTSAGHSPGATTSAVGLALTWPRPVLLVDADREPTQAILAGLLQGEDTAGRGLWGVLAAYRERRPMASAIGQGVVELPSTDGVERRFLPGFSHPGMVELFSSAWPDFAATLASWPADVILDAGRIGPRGLPAALVAEADAVVVVTRTSLVDLVGLRLYLPLVAQVVAAERLSLLLVGAGRPYSAGEITATFSVRVEEPLPWSPKEASVWSAGAVPPRSFAISADVRSSARCGEF